MDHVYNVSSEVCIKYFLMLLHGTEEVKVSLKLGHGVVLVGVGGDVQCGMCGCNRIKLMSANTSSTTVHK